MIRLLLGYNNTCHLQVAPMDCLTGESMKWSKTDQKLIKYLNLVIYFQSEIEHELWNINTVYCACHAPIPIVWLDATPPFCKFLHKDEASTIPRFICQQHPTAAH